MIRIYVVERVFQACISSLRISRNTLSIREEAYSSWYLGDTIKHVKCCNILTEKYKKVKSVKDFLICVLLFMVILVVYKYKNM